MNFNVIHRLSALELEICLSAKHHDRHGTFYSGCYKRMREATGRHLRPLKFTRHLAKQPQRLLSLSAWIVEGAPETSRTCTAADTAATTKASGSTATKS